MDSAFLASEKENATVSSNVPDVSILEIEHFSRSRSSAPLPSQEAGDGDSDGDASEFCSSSVHVFSRSRSSASLPSQEAGDGDASKICSSSEAGHVRVLVDFRGVRIALLHCIFRRIQVRFLSLLLAFSFSLQGDVDT